MKIISLLFLAAQINYLIAVDRASKTAGTDMEITYVMQCHGFNIDIMDPN